MSELEPQAAIDAIESWIVCPARNNLPLLRDAVASFLAQTGPTIGKPRVLVVNNGSSDGTLAWLESQKPEDVSAISVIPQRGVAHAWNLALRYLWSAGAKRVLVANQDVRLRPDTYQWLEAAGGLFVTGVGSDDLIAVRAGTPTLARRPHPDFSCFLIHRACWDRVGSFDERFAGAFCEDADYHVRMHLFGIEAYSIGLPFWHIGGGSQTVKRAGEAEQAEIIQRAEANRARFKSKWGFEVGSQEYYQFFGAEAHS